MCKEMLLNEFNLEKLDCFFRFSDRGFVILTVNEYHIMQKITGFISEKAGVSYYNVTRENFSSIINGVKSGTKTDLKLVYNFFLEDGDSIHVLEKFNLGRDLILERCKYCIFIVPLYIELYIQEKLPNLYSYCGFRERYLRKYNSSFSYIFPEDMYLKTKVMQKNLKENIYDAKDNIFESLDTFLHVKISEDIFEKLENDTNKFLDYIKLSDTQYDGMLYYKIQLNFAKVATAQKKFKKAIQVYQTLLKDENIIRNISIFIETKLGMADNYLYIGDYNKSYVLYSDILSDICTDLFDFLEDITIKEYKIQIYSRIALCQIKLGKIDEVKRIILQVMESINILEADGNREFFHIYYNFFIIYLEIYPGESAENSRMLELLGQNSRNEVQNAMYITVKAWYEGVIKGDIYNSIQNASTALEIKRNLYIENDVRIAESHYVNALLRFFAGNDEEAYYCCMKSCNILKNINTYINKMIKNYELLEEIRNYTI